MFRIFNNSEEKPTSSALPVIDYDSETALPFTEYGTMFWLLDRNNDVKRWGPFGRMAHKFLDAKLLREHEPRVLAKHEKADWRVEKVKSETEDGQKEYDEGVVDAYNYTLTRFRRIKKDIRDNVNDTPLQNKILQSLEILLGYHKNDEIPWIPDLLGMSDEFIDIINKNAGIISLKPLMKVFKEKHTSTIASINLDYNTHIKPILEQYISRDKLAKLHKDKEFDDLYILHQKFTFMVIYKLRHDLEAMDKIINILIAQKTRSGKSFVVPGIVVMYYHFNDRKPINVFITGYYPATFAAIATNQLTFDNIPITEVSVLDKDLPNKLSNTGINLIIGSHKSLHDKSRGIYELVDGNVAEKKIEDDVYAKNMDGYSTILKDQKIKIDIKIEDEAHIGTMAKKTSNNTKRFHSLFNIFLTATPNKEKLLEFKKIKHSYMEEQVYKKVMKIPDYKKYPDVVMAWLNPEDYPIFAKLAKMGVNPSDFLKNHRNELYQQRRNPLYHEDDKAMEELAEAVLQIHLSKDPSYRKKFKKFIDKSGVADIGFGISEWLKTIKKEDIPKADTIIKVRQRLSNNKLAELLLKNEIICKHFSVISLYGGMSRDDKYITRELKPIGTVADLQTETEEYGERPRLIILCEMGTTGATFKSVDATIVLCAIESPAAYIQTVERGGTPFNDKSRYFIFDYDIKRMKKFLTGSVIRPTRPFHPRPTFAEFCKLSIENNIFNNHDYAPFREQYNKCHTRKLPQRPTTYETFDRWGVHAWEILHGKIPEPTTIDTHYNINGNSENSIIIAIKNEKLQGTYHFDQIKPQGRDRNIYAGYTTEEIGEQFNGTYLQETDMGIDFDNL